MRIKELGRRAIKAVKNTLKAILNGIWCAVKKIYSIIRWFVIEITSATIHIGLIVVLALMLPIAHREYIAGHTAQHVYRLTNQKEEGGGTGFQVTAPSGKNYILTNSHICGLVKKGKKLKIKQAGMKRWIPKRIIEDSIHTDLCIVEGFPGKGGLKLADSVRMREDIAFVGHPLLNPIVIRRGEIIGEEKVEISIGPPSKCKGKPKNKVKTMELWWGGKRKVCMNTTNAYITDVTAYPGSSGSPVVDKFGDVVGIVFAIHTESHWGYFVPLEDIRDFLADY